MKRHKQIYPKRSDSCVNCYELVMIMRGPKKRSRIRWCMYWAWQVQSDKQYIKKYFKNDDYEAPGFIID
jgi:hypothetical protein